MHYHTAFAGYNGKKGWGGGKNSNESSITLVHLEIES